MYRNCWWQRLWWRIALLKHSKGRKAEYVFLKKERYPCSLLRCGTDAQTSIGLTTTIIKLDKGKGPATAALTAPYKERWKNKNLQNNYIQFSHLLFSLFSPKLPECAAWCCRVSQWESWAVLWSSHWQFASLWLKAQHLSWHFAVCQCDAAGTLCAAVEKRRSSVGLSLASSSSSTFSLLLSLGPRTHVVHRLTGGSTCRSLTLKSLKKIPIYKLLLGVVCKVSVLTCMQVKTVVRRLFISYSFRWVKV